MFCWGWKGEKQISCIEKGRPKWCKTESTWMESVVNHVRLRMDGIDHHRSGRYPCSLPTLYLVYYSSLRIYSILFLYKCPHNSSIFIIHFSSVARGTHKLHSQNTNCIPSKVKINYDFYYRM